MERVIHHDHLLMDLVQIRERLKQNSPSLQSNEGEAENWIRLYLEVNDKILQWTDREIERKRRLAEIETTLGNRNLAPSPGSDGSE